MKGNEIKKWIEYWLAPYCHLSLISFMRGVAIIGE
jgi:hypothetical protein